MLWKKKNETRNIWAKPFGNILKRNKMIVSKEGEPLTLQQRKHRVGMLQASSFPAHNKKVGEKI
jgi:hypothetical protein